MVTDVSERILVILFTEGLSEPLKGWIKAFDPPTLQEAMRKARSMELIAPSSRFTPRSTSSFRDTKKFDKNKGKKYDTKGKSTAPLNMETPNDLHRKKLCFYCKGTYDRDHDCPMRPKGKANRVMWAYYEDLDSDSSRHEDAEPKAEAEASEPKEEPELHLKKARLSSIQQEGSFRLHSVLAGQRVITLVDTGAMHNLIDARFVDCRGIMTEKFEGLRVQVADDYTLKCNSMVRELPLRLNNYEFKEDYHLVNMGDLDIVLGMK